MSTTVSSLTADDLFRLPNDGNRYELVRGELKQMSPAGQLHGKITLRLASRLATHVESNDLGVTYAAETGFIIARDPDTVRAPDIAFVRKSRLAAVPEQVGFWPGAPDLAVEVVSPNDTFAAVEEKSLAWLEAGTQVVVVVSPRNQSATVYRSLTHISILNASDVLDLSDVVDGFAVPLAAIFG